MLNANFCRSLSFFLVTTNLLVLVFWLSSTSTTTVVALIGYGAIKYQSKRKRNMKAKKEVNHNHKRDYDKLCKFKDFFLDFVH